MCIAETRLNEDQAMIAVISVMFPEPHNAKGNVNVCAAVETPLLRRVQSFMVLL
jgi:hypothetical protein